ncbi:hypothetical protein pb186bvf_020925 [Paramecium bursaria]
MKHIFTLFYYFFRLIKTFDNLYFQHSNKLFLFSLGLNEVDRSTHQKYLLYVIGKIYFPQIKLIFYQFLRDELPFIDDVQHLKRTNLLPTIKRKSENKFYLVSSNCL